MSFGVLCSSADSPQHTHGMVTTMSQPSAHLSGGDGVYLIAKHDFAMSTANLPLRLTMMKRANMCVFMCV